MKKLFLALIILAISFWLGAEIVADPGYILLARQHWSLEMPLWLGTLILLLSFFLLYFLLRIGGIVYRLPGKIRRWLGQRREKKQASLTTQSLLADLYLKPKNWPTILNTLPQLWKKKLLSEQHMEVLKQQSYEGLLQQTVIYNDLPTLRKTWRELPSHFRKQPKLLFIYVSGLLKHNVMFEAEKLIRKALKKNWDSQLAYAYGQVNLPHPTDQVQEAEGWLETHPQDPDLLLTLGHLCARAKLWGKARDYFEASLSFLPRAETHQALGKLLESLGERETAIMHFKKGLEKL